MVGLAELGGFGCGVGWLLRSGRAALGSIAEVRTIASAVCGTAVAVATTIAARLAACITLGAAGECFAGEGRSAVPAFGEGVKIGGRCERYRGCVRGCRGRCRCGAGLIALAILRERLAGKDDRLRGRCGVLVTIGVGDRAGIFWIYAVEIARGGKAAWGAGSSVPATLASARVWTLAIGALTIAAASATAFVAAGAFAGFGFGWSG